MGFIDIHYSDGEIFEINIEREGVGMPIPSINKPISKVSINHQKYSAVLENYHTYFFENEALIMFGGQRYVNFHIGGIRSDGSCHGYLFDKENISMAQFDLSNKSQATLHLLLKEGVVTV